ncbi:phospholipase A [Pollutimonas bauzanensis]|uniref:Phospholipase A1 n=1 Tax=Pollutimonas bauzanensis TaxID=658167 RepID=A0A1M5YPD3_9BURK|nr:phospholipase A [Pollutimonas bauzanensis]SHI13724.1 Outer membrane phospholipase A [Pollutimonas bauzanensis]
MICFPRTTQRFLQITALLGWVLMAATASAGITYRLDRPQALPGESVQVIGLLFNDTDTAITWTAPKNLVLQWRNQDGQAIRSLAYLATDSGQANVPVNNFVKFAWRAVVPTGVQGLQAVSIEGEAALLALDTSPLEKSPISGTPAHGPIVDAGAAQGRQREDPALPANVAAATGASLTQGPAVTSTATQGAAPSAFDNFRNAISPYEPIYFDLGHEDGRNARYQVSFKYRLFTPNDPANPGFEDNLYLGYTQTALWDLHSDSHPFVDTSFKPSVFWRKDAIWQSASKDWFVGFASGVEHESNGKSGDDSRALNFGYIQPEFNYRFDGGSTLTFAPRVKAYFGVSNNPDYADYAGHMDWKLRWAQDNGLVLSGMYRQGRESRSTTLVEAAWPLRRTFLNMNGYLHVQYFKGYGETVLGYNHKSAPQVRIGLALIP